MKVLITDADYPSLDLERGIFGEAGFEVETAQCRTPDDVIAAAQGASALLVQYAPITRAVMERLPQVRIVSRFGVGVDTVDLEAAEELGVWVANVPDYSVQEVSLHAIAMALALVRHLPFFDRDVRAGRWHYSSTGPLRRPDILTFGLVGMGRIGRTVAERAQPWFGQVVAYDPLLPDTVWLAGVERVELEQVFERSHVVSLHLPLSAETHGLVNRELLGRMPRPGYLVNTARGELVNLDDLLQSLDEGQLAGAALDVLPQEPLPVDHPIIKHPRVLLSPHAAFYSVESEQELRRKAALNIVRWAREGRPPYVVVEGRSDFGL